MEEILDKFVSINLFLFLMKKIDRNADEFA